MSTHLSSKLLYGGPDVAIRDVRCRPHDLCCSAEEHTWEHEIVIPRGGVFTMHAGRRQEIVDANQVMFFNAHEPYRVSHPVEGGDDCTVFTLQPTLLMEVLMAFDPHAADRPQRPFRSSTIPSSPAVALRCHLLRQLLRERVVEPLAIEEGVLDLLALALQRAPEPCRAQRKPARPTTLAAHAETIVAAQAFLSTNLGDRLSLDDVANAVYSSRFHLARLFREQTGTSIHEYRQRLRLVAALETLVDSRADLTSLALTLGFSSHSHFTTAFRRTFGIAPGEFRKRAKWRRLRQIRTNLKALRSA